MSERQAQDFYLSRKPQLLREFDKIAGTMQEILADRYGANSAQEITLQVRQAYEGLIPALPYIGGKKNSLTENLVGTAPSLAFYQVLRSRGEETQTIGELHQEMVEAHLASLPEWRFRLIRWVVKTRLGQWVIKRMLARGAAQSQKRLYPDNFVYEVVHGNGKDFDFGIDYTACAIVKFFRAQGAGDFTRYVCMFDYPHSKLTGTGLVRTQTLAEGADKCDFRFRIGREPENHQATKVGSW